MIQSASPVTLPRDFTVAATNLAREAERWADTLQVEREQLVDERLPGGVGTVERAQQAAAPLVATFEAFQDAARTPGLPVVDWRHAQEGFFNIWNSVQVVDRTIDPGSDFVSARADVLTGVRFLESVLGGGMPPVPYEPS